MNKTFRDHVRHTSLVLNRLNVCHDLWRQIAVLSLDTFDLSWPISTFPKQNKEPCLTF